jgi:hypothetical protein
MNIKPLESASFHLVQIKNGTPHCIRHGAMNKLTADGIWRCITVAGYEPVNVNGGKGKVHKENICRAGCSEAQGLREINFADHLEKQLANSLYEANIDFVHESESEVIDLDLFLPGSQVYIEVKQYHTPRIAAQTERHENIIVLQGKESVNYFCSLLNNIK